MERPASSRWSARGSVPPQRTLGAPERPPLRKKHRQRQIAGLATFIKACHPIIYVVSSEEGRFLRNLNDRYAKQVLRWTYTKGLVNLRDGRCVDQATIGDPLFALRFAEKSNTPTLYVFCDLHPWLEKTGASHDAAVRMLRDIYHQVRGERDMEKTVILLSPLLIVPAELEKEVVVFDFPLPDRDELGALLDDYIDKATLEASAKVHLNAGQRDKLLEAAMGLTLDEADNAFCAAFLNDGVLDTADIHVILAEKQLIIRQSGVLDYTPAEDDLDEIGGLEHLKEWLRKRALAYSQEARDFDIPSPKGVLLTGVQGCGKSLAAKAIAHS